MLEGRGVGILRLPAKIEELLILTLLLMRFFFFVLKKLLIIHTSFKVQVMPCQTDNF